MSTKIYNAYKATYNIEQLMKFIKELKKDYLKECKRKIINCRTHSSRNEEYKKMSYFEFIDEVKKQMNSGIQSEMNISASICVFFYENNIYIQFFEVPYKLYKNKIKTASIGGGFLIDFHFQNSTDCPGEISEKEWKHREKTWELIVPSGVPSDSGLVFNLINTYDVCYIVKEALKECGVKFYD